MKPCRPPEYKMERTKGIVKMSEFRRYVIYVSKAIGYEVTVDGLDISETAEGIHLKNKATAAEITDNFYVTLVGDGQFKVSYGEYASLGPTLGGYSLYEEDALGSLSSSNCSIYLRVVYNLISDAGYVYSAPFAGEATIECADELPADETSDGIYYIRIAPIVAGEVVRPQPVRRSLNGFVEDDGSGLAKGILSPFSAG